jgi:hypothetical protein
MTVQRQYILPNCNLIIEGLIAGDESDPTSPLTVVLNSEFTFPGTVDRLSGGREFLNAIVKTVSDYAQSLLSGVPYPLEASPSESQPVTLTPTVNQRHQLIATVTDANQQTTQKTVELNSVQLFDLMEAIDQLMADNATLPDMTLQVAPLNRRHARPAEPVTKRVIPAAVGISTLAASAALLFLVPVPEFEPTPREEEDVSELVETEADNLANGDDAADDPPVTAEDAAEPAIADSEDTDTDAPEPPLSEAEEADETEDSFVGPVAAGIALGRLSAADAIADDGLLNDLEAELESKLATALEDLADGDELPFEESLTYRIAVSETGDILGYKYENDAALDNIDATPLPTFTFVPVDTDSAVEERVAQFRLTFEPDGTVIAEPIIPDAESEEAD